MTRERWMALCFALGSTCIGLKADALPLAGAERSALVQGNVSALLGQLLEPRGAEGSTRR